MKYKSATPHFLRWQKIVLKEQGLNKWKIKNVGKGDGLCMWEAKTILCTPNSYALFLHEIAHALVPQKDPKEYFHGGVWADIFTSLCEKYLVSLFLEELKK